MSPVIFEKIFNFSPLPIYVLQDGYFCMVNPEMEGVTGYTAYELLQIPFTALIYPEDRSLVVSQATRRLAGEDVSDHYGFRAINRGGDIIHVKGYFSRIEHNGRPAILGQILNITEQKRVEDALRESEEKYRIVIENANEAILVAQDGMIKFTNPKATKMTGYTGDELKSNPFTTFIHPEDREMVMERFLKRLEGEDLLNIYPFRIIDKQGKIIWVEINSVAVNWEGSPAVLCFLPDITERRNVEEALQESEARLRRITDTMLDVIYQIDTEGNIQYVSSSCKSVLGFETGDIIGKSIFDFVHPDDLNKVRNSLNTCIDICSFDNCRFRFRHADGRFLWLETISNPLLDDKGFSCGAILCTRDITKRKQVEEELILQKAYFQQLFENSPQGIVILDNEDRVINANKGFKELFQFGIEEIKGSSINEMIVPSNLLDEASSFSQVVVAGNVVQKETVRKRKDGSLVNVFILGYPIMAEGKQQGIYAIYSDITERKQAEEQLKYLSLRDPLTGLHNRAYFEQEMSRLGVGNDFPLGIILFDVDGLKLVNDIFGHNKGDALLVSVARLIRDSFRESDVVARIGGDEFAVLLPKSSELTVESTVHRVRYAIKKHNVKNKELPISISIGFATSGKESKNLYDLFKEADNNMYREKLHSSQSARSAIVQTLMKAMEARDFVAEGHANRLQALVSNLAASIGLSDQQVTDLRLLAKFHDIGKVGILDRILFKEGSLNWEEVYEMRRHCEIGHRIAKSAPVLVPIADWILKHHEWWDGTGYPLGLKGEEIPLECRILAIADAYDAMTSERPYRKAISHEKAVNELIRCSGTQFDPDLLSAFIRMFGISVNS